MKNILLFLFLLCSVYGCSSSFDEEKYLDDNYDFRYVCKDTSGNNVFYTPWVDYLEYIWSKGNCAPNGICWYVEIKLNDPKFKSIKLKHIYIIPENTICSFEIKKR